MGYYTHYKLKVFDSEGYKKNVEDYISSLLVISDAEYALTECGDTKDSWKWYDHETDLLEYSKAFPNVVFELSGEGEEPGDLWRKYFWNGRMQVAEAQIVYPPYDPEKLTGRLLEDNT